MSTLSYDEFKKSLVRIASLCSSKIVKTQIDGREMQKIVLKKRT